MSGGPRVMTGADVEAVRDEAEKAAAEHPNALRLLGGAYREPVRAEAVLMIDSADLCPVGGGIELCVKDMNGSQPIAEASVHLRKAAGVEVKKGRKYRVSIEEVG